MKTNKAIIALMKGKKIRQKSWEPHEYVYIDKDGDLVCEKGEYQNFCIADELRTKAKWELYAEPDEKEVVEALNKIQVINMDQFLQNSINYLMHTVPNFYKVDWFKRISSDELHFTVWTKGIDKIGVDDFEDWDEEVSLIVFRKVVDKWIKSNS